MKPAGAFGRHTLAELAALKLPGLPHTRQGLAKRADVERWSTRLDADGVPLAGKRAGRGGGWEYSVALLPHAARRALGKMHRPTAPVVPITTDYKADEITEPQPYAAICEALARLNPADRDWLLLVLLAAELRG